MPSSLKTFLQGNPPMTKADLFVISPPKGATIYIAEGQWDIKVASGTNGWSGSTQIFSATGYGSWTRGTITSEAGFSLAANSMALTCVPQQGVNFPGTSLGLLAAAFNGLFDASTVTVYTAYMPLGSYGNVSYGLETKFVGFIEKITDINRTEVVFEVQDPMYLLNEKLPKRLIQSSCPWSFGDSNCNVAGGVSAFTQNFTAYSASSQSILRPVTAFTQASGYFAQGVAKCLTGANAGLSQTVKQQDNVGSFVLTAAANASGGNTVYTGTLTGGASNAFATRYFTVAGFTNSANNGTYVCTASSATTITLANASGIAETHAGTVADLGSLHLTMPFILPVAPGDTFSVIAGCDKSATACKTRVTAAGSPVDNSIHFGGAIDVPVPITGL